MARLEQPLFRFDILADGRRKDAPLGRRQPELLRPIQRRRRLTERLDGRRESRHVVETAPFIHTTLFGGSN
ncbi:hypothetical protein [Halapricum desulfuricans]|uniref:hypothetical protein n=1 Tax=Halapricum desulfuricans TaxID=2841257 RepID=UPI001E363630|nr:hypothetical protein [Halapricum desulfuricans]